MELSKSGNLPVCSFWTRLLTRSSVRLALSRSLNFSNPSVSSGKLSLLSLLKSWRYSARQKLINSSVGKPVSLDHHESVVAFSGVSARAVFTGFAGCADQYHVRRFARSRMGSRRCNRDKTSTRSSITASLFGLECPLHEFNDINLNDCWLGAIPSVSAGAGLSQHVDELRNH
jgi:hypothetical protein